jgi:hypothetical protein
MRRDGTTSYKYAGWEDMKYPYGNDTDFCMGMEDLHERCGKFGDCELAIMMTVAESGNNYFY